MNPKLEDIKIKVYINEGVEKVVVGSWGDILTMSADKHSTAKFLYLERQGSNVMAITW